MLLNVKIALWTTIVYVKFSRNKLDGSLKHFNRF